MAPADVLVEQAIAATGLDDFGGDGWHDGLTRLIETVDTHPGPGADAIRREYLGALTTRLQVIDYAKCHPEVTEAPVERPLVVLGLPRTGTTLTSHLLGQDPARRPLLKWETVTPVPPATTATLHTDPRCLALKARLGEALAARRAAGGQIPHWDGADDATECCFVQAHDFKSLLWESAMPTADYSDWYLDADVTSTYEYERTVLQILQSHAPGTWSLKLPSHAVHIETLLRVFPDARVVWAHRDPFRATASYLSMNELSRPRLAGDAFDVTEVVPWVLRQLRAHVERPLRVAEREPDRIFHLHYAAVMRDPIGQMKALYEWAGDPLTADTEQAMIRWLEEHPQDRFGPRPYALDTYGLTTADLEPVYDEYLSAFDVELEG